MAETVIASKITDGQIDNVVDKLRAAMRKNRKKFTKDIAQKVLGVENLGMEMLEVFQRHVKAISEMVVRRVKVDRGRIPQQALDATNSYQSKNQMIVDSMPKGKGDEVELFFFKPVLSDRGGISYIDLVKEFKLRGLTPADPYSLMAANELDPVLVKEFSNGTFWKDGKGRWCYIGFRRSISCERHVRVEQDSGDWGDDWWFAGIRE